MMLRYLGLGKRRLGDHTMPAHARLNWEFLAVVRGKVAPFAETPDGAVPVEHRLWLYPPGVVHGWIGEPGKACEIVVIHFSSVPASIERLATTYGLLETPLTPGDREALQRLVRVLKAHYWDPTLESELKAQGALMDLCLMMVRGYEERTSRQISGGSYSRIVAAEEWLRTHLTDPASVASAARHVGLSTSQLYRLFAEVRKESPQDYLNRAKIERAMQLLGQTNAKLEKVAAECGYSTASNLCRAFKAAKGRSPTAWRRETYIQYKVPPKGAEGDHTRFGERVRPAL
jgi:AraC-like DNA-binding protein